MRVLSKSVGLALLTGLLFSVGAEARTRIYVRLGPPPVVVEQRVVSPGPNYVWQPGYQAWNGNAYVWTPGQWVAAPYSRARWVEGRWVRTSRGYYREEGRWVRTRR